MAHVGQSEFALHSVVQAAILWAPAKGFRPPKRALEAAALKFNRSGFNELALLASAVEKMGSRADLRDTKGKILPWVLGRLESPVVNLRGGCAFELARLLGGSCVDETPLGQMHINRAERLGLPEK